MAAAKESGEQWGNEFGRGGDSGAIVEFCAEGFTPRGNPVRRTWAVSVSRQATSETWGGGGGGLVEPGKSDRRWEGGRNSGIGIFGEVWRGRGSALSR